MPEQSFSVASDGVPIFLNNHNCKYEYVEQRLFKTKNTWKIVTRLQDRAFKIVRNGNQNKKKAEEKEVTQMNACPPFIK